MVTEEGLSEVSRVANTNRHELSADVLHRMRVRFARSRELLRKEPGGAHC